MTAGLPLGSSDGINRGLMYPLEAIESSRSTSARTASETGPASAAR